jgi:hypothetical protein
MRARCRDVNDSPAVKVTPLANQLLAALPKAAYRRLLPDLTATSLIAGQSLLPTTGPLPFAYFPADSIVTSSFAIGEGAGNPELLRG